ncbi:MAG TPA: ribonuclease H-like domain-containing protein [Caldisericia bacterium]|nr:ribonuclease H-like domain-containing protein [Caldisericia bacterium]
MENKNRRYRLKDSEVEKLNLSVNLRNRYRLSKEQERELLKMRESQYSIKRLFFDIETSAMIVYSWRIGWNITLSPDNIIQDWKIICISYKWEGEDSVHTLDWGKKMCDKKLLEDFIKVANTADELVAHNGDRFDVKKIRTRCISHRIPMFPNYKTLDTLKKAKSGFNFNSNKLDYIAKFLGVGAKLEHEGFNMWVKCMQGDKEALKAMIEYCEMDIIVLEDVFLTMQNYIKHNTHVGVINNNLKYSCPCCGSENVSLQKNVVTAMGTIKRQMNCDDCNYSYETSNSSYINYLKFKNVI